MKIKKLACVLSFVGISISSMKAQSNVVSTGGDAYSSASGSVSYTIGQLDFQFHAGSGGNSSEGVQQAYLIQSNGLLNPEQMQVSIWPNPTSDLVNIQIQESMLNRTLFIFDAQGKCVLNQFYRISIPASTWLLSLRVCTPFASILKTMQRLKSQKHLDRNHSIPINHEKIGFFSPHFCSTSFYRYFSGSAENDLPSRNQGRCE